MSFNEDPTFGNKKAENLAEEIVPTRRRMNIVDRKRQILERAIQFFAKHGIDGQLRNLNIPNMFLLRITKEKKNIFQINIYIHFSRTTLN